MTIVDVDEEPHIARSAGVKGVPSLLKPDAELIVGAEKILTFFKELDDSNSNS